MNPARIVRVVFLLFFAVLALSFASSIALAQDCMQLSELWNWPIWLDCQQGEKANNCYNFATDRHNCTWGQPGVGSSYWGIGETEIPPSCMTCAQIKAAAISDGLEFLSSGYLPGGSLDPFPITSQCPPDTHIVALVIDPYDDFHWYRQERTGLWTQKQSWWAATDKDDSDNFIPDPRTANRGRYTDFCGFFRVSPTVSVAGGCNGCSSPCCY